MVPPLHDPHVAGISRLDSAAPRELQVFSMGAARELTQPPPCDTPPRMHHRFIDNYSSGTGALHRADPRMKIALAAIILVCIVTARPADGLVLAVYAATLAALWLVTGVPSAHLAKRMALVLPLVAFIAAGTLITDASAAAWQRLGIMLAKAALAIAVMSLVTSTTPFPRLIRGLEWYGMPRIMSAVMAFLYRYIFILIDEFERLSIGRQSRRFGGKRALAWKSGAWMIGTLFVRSMERSERIYRAMLSRGFDGRMHALDERTTITAAQATIGTLAAAWVVAVRMAPFIMQSYGDLSS